MKKLLIFSAIILATIVANAQQGTPTRVGITDETWGQLTKTSYKIITSNEDIGQALICHFKKTLKSYTVRAKKDRNGPYNEYTIYFKVEEGDKIVPYLKEWNRGYLSGSNN